MKYYKISERTINQVKLKMLDYKNEIAKLKAELAEVKPQVIAEEIFFDDFIEEEHTEIINEESENVDIGFNKYEDLYNSISNKIESEHKDK